jgi:hypothetical protein
MWKRLILIAAITVFAAAGQAKDEPQLTVEVLKAETVHWTTYWHDNGSAGRTTTDCDIYDTSASCTSTTQGARPASTTPIYHTQVNLLGSVSRIDEITAEVTNPDSRDIPK